MRRPSNTAVEVAQLVIDRLANDEQFVEEVTRKEITRRIEAGELVPAESLRVTGGLELTPVGRVSSLETGVKVLLAVLADVEELTDAQQEAIARVQELISEPAQPPDQAGEADGLDLDQADEHPIPVAEPVLESAAEPDDSRRYPTGFPAGASYVCGSCSGTVSEEQALLSWTRFREVLCSTDLANH